MVSWVWLKIDILSLVKFIQILNAHIYKLNIKRNAHMVCAKYKRMHRLVTPCISWKEKKRFIQKVKMNYQAVNGKIPKEIFLCNTDALMLLDFQIRCLFIFLLHRLFLDHDIISNFRQHKKFKLSFEYFWKYYGKWSICSKRSNAPFYIIFSNLWSFKGIKRRYFGAVIME